MNPWSSPKYEAAEGCPGVRVRIYSAALNEHGEPWRLWVQYIGTEQALVAADIATVEMLRPAPAPLRYTQRRLDAEGDYFQVVKQGRVPRGDPNARYAVMLWKAPEAALRLPGAQAVWRLEEWQERKRVDAEEREAWRAAEAARRPLPPSLGSFEVAGPDTWQ